MAKRVALVTGAGRGIGEAVAHALAEAGAAVALNDIDAEAVGRVAAAIAANGGQAAAFGHDISSSSHCDELVAEVAARFGRLDILVNNAGIVPRVSLEDMTEEIFDRVVAVNLKSVFFLSRAAGREMKKNGWGRIVNMSSTGARTGGLVNATVYSATKAGIVSMTKSFARMYAKDNILVNAVAPGSVNTRMMTNLPDEALRFTLEGVPLGRLSEPSEIAVVVAFLASDACSYMTGATVDVNGGAVMP
jgi:NAD(P)-dependent dehydrogenase (short-subunit alcohol dehydrogenase family)